MRNNLKKRLLSLLLVVSLLAAYAVPVYAADDASGVSFEQVDNSEVSASVISSDTVDETAEPEYADTDIVRVSIVLSKASTLEAGYSTLDIASNASAMSYRAELEEYQASTQSRIESKIGSSLDVVWNLTLAADIISAWVAYGDIAAIESVSGVEQVVIENQYEAAVAETDESSSPNMATSSSMIGSSTAYLEGYTGAGSRIAIIDTGVDSDHQSFDAGAYEYALAQIAEEKGMSYEEYVESLDLLDAEEIASVAEYLNVSIDADTAYVSSKIPYAYNYIDEDYDITHDNDSQGEHGSHVTGIAAANSYIPNGDGTYSSALTTVSTQGVAPEAQIITMKVFGKGGGAYDSDYMVAIEDAIILGADVINLSLGSSSAGFTTSATDVYQAIMDSLTESDTVVSISAGNAYSWSQYTYTFANYVGGGNYIYADGVNMDTVGSPGSFTNALTVASADNTGTTGAYFTIGDDVVIYTETSGYGNEAFTTLAGEQKYVMIDSVGTEDEFAAIADELEGAIAVCYRGTTSFYEKANAAVANGAIGVIVVNNTTGTISMNLSGYLYSAPVVSVTQSTGELLKAAGTDMDGYYVGTITVSSSVAAVNDPDADVTISSFSSWGVPGDLSIKPEITAPGGSIYSVNGADTSGTAYEQMSGTSMAAPQVAGMTALIAQYIRENDLDEQTGLSARVLAQSLLMSTAVPLTDADSGYEYYSILQQGSGLANVGAAVTASSYILMGEDATDSASDGKIKAELGDDPDKDGIYSFSFSINNLTDEDQVYTLSADLFTQDVFYWYVDESYNIGLYMDTATTGLAYTTAWTVDGVTVDPDGEAVAGMDFNGDGVVNLDDGQALLDYATGAIASIENEDLADLNGDDLINSYDAYLFFVQLGSASAIVPASGSVTVTVTVTLSDAQKTYLDTYYENGAYIEGFIYATEVASGEGVEGTSHSIPMLAFYGNWTDSSMFDLISWTEYYDGDTRWNYMGTYYSNYVTVKYGDGSGTYTFGGNPLFYEDYDETRNALSTVNGDSIGSAVYSLIRNAAAGKLTIVNETTGETEYEYDFSRVNGAYYYSSGGSWYNTSSSIGLNFTPSGDEGDVYTITLTAAPEYYVASDGSVDWDALGDGASLSISFTVDNTAPTVWNVSGDVISSDASSLTIAVADNQYVAGAYLFDSTGTTALWSEAGSQENAGDGSVFTIDLADLEVEDGVYLLQVYDYAMNVSTYRIFVNVEATDTVDGITLSSTDVTIVKGSTTGLSATVSPANASDITVTWSSSDESIATVNANGLVTGVAAGEATITATSNLDPNVSASCAVEVITIEKTLNGIVWDENGEVWWSSIDVGDASNYTKLTEEGLDAPVWSLALQDDTLYAHDYNGCFYSVDVDTFDLTMINSATSIDYFDMAETYHYNGYILAAYGPYIAIVNPTSGDYLGVFNLSSYVSGYITAISYCYSVYNTNYSTYGDYYYFVDVNGNVYRTGVIITSSGMSRFGVTKIAETGIAADAYYYNSAYFDYDSGYLYYSVYANNTNTMYAIDVSTGASYELSSFGTGVWPAAALIDLGIDGSGTDSGTSADTAIAEEVMQSAEIETLGVTTPKGSLNALVAPETPAEPSSDSSSQTGTIVTVNVTTDVLSHNGIVTVEYDAEDLALFNVKAYGDYTSIVEGDGIVTIGYVSMDGIEADGTVATLQFVSMDECCDKTIAITYQENNDDFEESLETLTVEGEHSWDEGTVTKEATCTEDGEIVYTCTVCGETYTEVIPATGHTDADGDNICDTCGAVLAPTITSVYASSDGSASAQTRVKITWTAVDGADGYKLYRSTSIDGEYTLVKTITDGSTTSYTNSGLELGVTYYYKVLSYTGDVCTNLSEAAYAPACATFTSVYASGTDRVRLIWNAVDGASGYQIWRADSEDGEYKIIKTITSGDTTAYTNTGLDADQTYYYKIRAYATADDGSRVYGAYSDVTSVTTVYVGSTTMTATSYSSGIAKLAWSAVDGAEGYQILRADSEDGTYSVVKTITSGTTTSYNNSGLESGKTYYYKIRAYSVVDGSKTYGDYSAVVSVTVK